MALLGLPERRDAKYFIFRILYGGTGHGFAVDARFAGISTDVDYWDKLIAEFYRKYTGLKLWHDHLVETVMRDGYITVPSGREFHFVREYGKWPRTKILNYPVQGFSADLMVLARVLLKRKLDGCHGINFNLCCTVHDSVVVDCPSDSVDTVVHCIYETWRELPAFFDRCFQTPLDVPMNVEVLVGENWKEMEDARDNWSDLNNDQGA